MVIGQKEKEVEVTKIKTVKVKKIEGVNQPAKRVRITRKEKIMVDDVLGPHEERVITKKIHLEAAQKLPNVLIDGER